MNFSPLKFLHFLSGKVIMMVIAFLAVCGIGVYVYTHQGSELTFHQDWTETDRRQMQEIVNFQNEKQEELSRQNADEFHELVESFSLTDWDDWPRLCKGICKYCRWYLRRDKLEEFFDADVVFQTARTGNASYAGDGDWTLLTIACGLGKRELACHLINKGADVNIRTREEGEYSDAPINWLVCGGMDFSHSMDADTVIYLMEELAAHGADLNVKALDLLSPFEMLCGLSSYSEEDKERMLFKLIDLGADVVSPFESKGKKRSSLNFPVIFGQSKVVRRLCEMGVDVNEGYDWLPPLFFIDPTKRPEDQLRSAQILLDHGARINASLQARHIVNGRGKTGQTPLSLLCSSLKEWDISDEKRKQCLLGLFSLYFERKADVNLASADGMTPLMFLFEKSNAGKDMEFRMELARRLLGQGADPSLKNGKGETVLDMIKKHPGEGREILDKLPELQPGKGKTDVSDSKG